jgi:disulfide bond formation protein DsbB
MWYRTSGALTPILVGAAPALAAFPAWSAGNDDALKGEPGNLFVYAVIIVIFIGALIAIALVRAAVAQSSWSLADALSEEAEVTAMDKETGQPLRDKADKVVMVTELCASSSRLIAFMGMLVILLMFLGFGTFALYWFAKTGKMPSGMDDVINFLVAGLTLFAPYVVNKFSSLFESLAPKK